MNTTTRELDPLGGMVRALVRARWYLFVGVLIGAVAFGVLAQLAVRQYRSEVKFTIRQDFAGSGGLRSQLAAQLGGVASLLGAGAGGGDSEKGRALELLTSYGFLAAFVRDANVMKVLYPADAGKGEPIRTEQDAVRRLKGSIISVTENRRTGVFSLAVRLPNRELAAAWANLLLVRGNDYLRNEAIQQSTLSRQFLEEQVLHSAVASVREAGFKLIESELKNEMMARTQSNYAFMVIDGAYVPDEKFYVYPKRAVMVVGGAMAGGGAGFMVWCGVAIIASLRRRFSEKTD